MCDGIRDFGWLLVSSSNQICDLEDTFFLYDKTVLIDFLCKQCFNAAHGNLYHYECKYHDRFSPGKSLDHWDDAPSAEILDELLDSVPFCRAKSAEILPYVHGLNNVLFNMDVTPALLWTILFNLMGMVPPSVSPGWLERAKCASMMLKSLDAVPDVLRWAEMTMLAGYDYHESDLDAVAAKFCTGNKNLTPQVEDELLSTFFSVAGPVRYSSLGLMEYMFSLRWATAGSVSGVKKTWTADGDKHERRITKNMLIDWYTPDQMLDNLLRLDRLDCTLAMKNEVSKQRPVVGAEPWSYMVMSWMMEKIAPWVKTIDGFFVYVDGTALYDLLRNIKDGKPVVACRGDDIIVTLPDGRNFSFDFKEFDHQISMRYVRNLWNTICEQVPMTDFERKCCDKVSFLLGHVVLTWYVKGVRKTRPMLGSLASGIRLTTLAGTSVSRAVAELLKKSADPWSVVSRLNLLFSRAKCYIRRGGEFLRCYASHLGVTSYPARSVVAVLQHKPWLDVGLSRTDALFKAIFVTRQRLGDLPPFQVGLGGKYGCPKLYGGLGIDRFGWDFCKVVRDDAERISGVPIQNRANTLVARGLPDDLTTLGLAKREIDILYGNPQGQRIVSGGYKHEEGGFGKRWALIRYDMLKFSYWEEAVGWWRACTIVAPQIADFVRSRLSWGRQVAFKLCTSGPEKPMCCRLFLDSGVLVSEAFWPGRPPGSVREYYRKAVDTLRPEYAGFQRVAS